VSTPSLDEQPTTPGSLVTSFKEQIWPPEGTDARVGAHLEQHYGSPVSSVSTLDAGVFAVDWADGRKWVARLSPPSRPAAVAEGDARILRFLEERSFPAERCAQTQAVTSMDGRAVLVTGRVEGTSGRQARGIRLFRTLGDMLGRLHTLTAPDDVCRRPAGSWHHLSFTGGGRRTDIANLTRLLADAQAIAPANKRALYDPLRERLGRLDACDDLPQALTHPDFSTPNVIMSAGGPVLVDWTNAGSGARVLALGTLLICAGGDEKLVGAIVEGYRRHVRLQPDEIARLPDAIRGFGFIIDCWAAVFRPHALERIVRGRVMKWYVAKTVAARAMEHLRAE
jgi:Ser/Thr protein kinase RdoA (MazF antagonist)